MNVEIKVQVLVPNVIKHYELLCISEDETDHFQIISIIDTEYLDV